MNAVKKLMLSFKYAFSGILYCLRHCRNFRIHTIAVVYVLYFSTFYSFDKTVYVLLCTLFALILSLEAMNTALEQTCDAGSEEFSYKIKHAKDVAAGAVFIAALFAVVIAVILFWDITKFKVIGNYFLSVPLRIVAFLISVAVFAVFIFFEDIFKNGKQ